MIRNARASVGLFEQEDVHYQSVYGFEATTLDDYTDAWMLRIAFYDGEESALQKSIKCYYYGYANGETNNVIESMIAYLNGMEGYTRLSYARYWHGYLVILKPLLYFFDYGDIRGILKGIELAFVLSVCILMAQKNMQQFIPAFAASLVCIEFHVVGMSLQYSWVFLIAMTASVIILKCYPDKIDDRRIKFLFLMIGMCTSYFDFLTYPVFTLGVPLIILTLCRIMSERTAKLPIRTICNAVCWGAGYAGMWFLKWLIGSILTDENIILDGIQSVLYRSGVQNEGEQIGYGEVLWENIRVLCKYPYVLAVGAAVIWIFALRKKYRLQMTKDIAVTMLMLTAIPFAWYAISLNHSYIHAFMTYRDLGIAIMGGLCLLTVLASVLRRDSQEGNDDGKH